MLINTTLSYGITLIVDDNVILLCLVSSYLCHKGCHRIALKL